MQDEPDDADELNPRERGVMIGRAWAESQEADPITALQLATKGTIPDDVRTRERVLDALVDYIENPKAFWEGFIHGVREYLVEQGLYRGGG
jgi:hypothetical protein